MVRSIQVSSEGGNQKERIEMATSLIAPQFYHDPCITYLMNSLTDDKRVSYMVDYFRVLISAAILNRGSVYEASNWKSAAIVVPPGRDVANPIHFFPAGGLGVLVTLGLSATVKMIYEFPRAMKSLKSREVGGSADYFYVFIVATVPEGRGQGLATAILKDVLQMAQREKKPAWIEATTESSKAIYAKVGFRSLGPVVLGKGKADVNGFLKTGGPGVKVWPMVWKPSKTNMKASP